MAENYPAVPSPAGEFARRPASTAWEQIPLDSAGKFIWAWYKPPAFPLGIVFRVPDEAFTETAAANWAQRLTMRVLLTAIGLDPATVSIWYQYGTPCQGRNGSSPLFDQPLPPPPAGVDPQIVVMVDVPAAEMTVVPGPASSQA